MKKKEKSQTALTPSALSTLPRLLREVLAEVSLGKGSKGPVLVSSNRLANRFIIQRYGIRPSQRKRNKRLFTEVRARCRLLLRFVLMQKKLEWKSNDRNFSFGAFKYDQIRGNLIIGFVASESRPEWVI